jgi:hypothetical protein
MPRGDGGGHLTLAREDRIGRPSQSGHPADLTLSALAQRLATSSVAAIQKLGEFTFE